MLMSCVFPVFSPFFNLKLSVRIRSTEKLATFINPHSYTKLSINKSANLRRQHFSYTEISYGLCPHCIEFIIQCNPLFSIYPPIMSVAHVHCPSAPSSVGHSFLVLLINMKKKMVITQIEVAWVMKLQTKTQKKHKNMKKRPTPANQRYMIAVLSTFQKVKLSVIC